MILIKSTGIVRRLDTLGRVVLPIEVRRQKDLEEKDPIEIFVDGDYILLRKYEPHCLLCEDKIGTIYFKGKLLCPECINYFKQAGV